MSLEVTHPLSDRNLLRTTKRAMSRLLHTEVENILLFLNGPNAELE